MPITINSLAKIKSEGNKFSCLTAYDASFACSANDAGIEVLLVGDSLGMTIQGHKSTIPVTMEHMVYHTAAVAKGNRSALIMTDMPFMSCLSPHQTLKNAQALMQAGAHILKIEGGSWVAPYVEALKQQGVPVCVHLGLTPQAVHTLGGFKAQAKDAQAANELIDSAMALERAGADLVLVECIPPEVTRRLYESLKVPLIGIGAGPDCDGQILVVYDILGIPDTPKARFAKNYLKETSSIPEAMGLFRTEVLEGTYPQPEHCFT